MKFSKNDLLLYAVTDRRWLNGAPLPSHVEAALKGGATFIQLREKSAACEERAALRALAAEIKTLCAKYNVPFVINDDVELAREIDADGVHVGQSDMEASAVRNFLGAGKILGVSATTIEEALIAEKNGADYIGVGAVFPTGTKSDAAQVSYKTLKEISAAVKIPVVAIGGITKQNLRGLEGSGIAGVALVSAIFAAENIERETAELKGITAELFCREK